MGDLIKAKISGLALDITTNSPVVVLKPEDSKSEDEDRVLPIWIGHFEAMAIAMSLSNVTQQRPMTHDLIRLVLEGFGSHVEKVAITELKEQTFYAVIYVERDGKLIQIDSRPSDSIAVALRCDAPIYVNSDLFHLDKSEDAPEVSRMLKR